MLQRSAFIPAPEPDDPDDVAVALETASALWGIGEKEEAIRRVRRAADGAEQAGNDLRAVKLARIAADLASAVQAEAAAPGESLPPPPPVRTPPPPPMRTPPPPARPQPAPAARAPSRRPPPPSAKMRMPPPPPEPTAATPPPPPARPRSAPPPLPQEPPATARSESEQGPDVWHAIRVSVKPSARDPNMFILRRLEPRTPAPRGTQEALIVVLDPSSDLLGAPIAPRRR